MYTIVTAYGDVYRTDDDGYVLEYSNGLKEDPAGEDRKTWQITGVWFSIGFGHVGYLSLDEAIDRGDFLLKNGLPRYGLTDIDHGTKRLQGNKDYHGVVSMTRT